MLADWSRDLRYAIRSLGRHRAFAAGALLTLALGIGLATTMFTVTDGILVRPLPFQDPGRLVAVWPSRFLPNADVWHIRDHVRSFRDVATVSPGWGVALTGVEEPTQLAGARISWNLFATLGVKAVLGRTFAREEGAPGADRVALLSHETWRTRFGADSAVVGRRVALGGAAHTIVGVMPPGLTLFQPTTDIWQPLADDPEAWYHRGGAALVVARLAADASIDRAAADLATVIAGMRETLGYADDYGQGATLEPLKAQLVAGARRELLVITGGVAFVLLMVMGNVANLFLARAAERRREAAVRTALGAGRGRLWRHLAAECLAVSGIGGALGLLVALWGVHILRISLPPGVPRLAELSLGWRAIGAWVAAVMASTVVMALATTLGSATASPSDALRLGAAARATDRLKARGAFVVIQLALAQVLVLGAGLMVQTLWRLRLVETGFDAANVLTLRVQPTGLSDGEERLGYYGELLATVEASPEVEHVGAIQHLPMDGVEWSAELEIEGRPWSPRATPPRVGWRIVAGEYFRTMGIPIAAGRAFTASDHRTAPPSVIVSERLASRFWPGENPLGTRIRAGNATGGEWATIVGVAGSVRHSGLDTDWSTELYRPIAQYPRGSMVLVARTRTDPRRAQSAIVAAVRSVDPDVPVSAVRPLDAVVRESEDDRRAVMGVLAAFAIVGLSVSGIGVYSLVAYGVSRRTRELGLRIALGADRRRVIRLILSQGALYGAGGVALGIAGALAVSHSLANLVFGVSPTDPVTFGAVAAALFGIALLGAYVPARRAARVDPIVALRDE